MSDWHNIKDVVLEKKEEYSKRFYGFFENIFDESISVGLDMGHHAIKVVQLERKPHGFTLLSLGAKKIPAGSSDSKTKFNTDVYTSLLNELWEEQKINTKKVKVTISDPAIYMRHISVPRIQENELAKAIKWQAEKYIPFSVDDAVVDFQVLDTYSSSDQNQMDIVIIAAEIKVIENYLNVLKAAKLKPVIIDITPFSITKAYLKNYQLDDKNLIALIDIGAGTTSLILLKGESLMFVRKFELGGNHITKTIAKGMNLDFAQTEKIKCESSSSPPEIGNLMAPVIEEMVGQIERSFAYCGRELLEVKIKKIVLTGGGAQLKGLDKVLGKKFSLPVEWADPFKNTRCLDLSSFRKDALSSKAVETMAALGSAL